MLGVGLQGYFEDKKTNKSDTFVGVQVPPKSSWYFNLLIEFDVDLKRHLLL